MSKYEIVELNTGEYAVRSKQNWLERLLGWETYHSWNIQGFTHSSPKYWTRMDSLNSAKHLISKLEERDYVNTKRKVIRIIND